MSVDIDFPPAAYDAVAMIGREDAISPQLTTAALLLDAVRARAGLAASPNSRLGPREIRALAIEAAAHALAAAAMIDAAA
ncbi:MAG: hypothetical protein JO290_03305 [Sphingomonadaceae bacterium]|nr:hypothetical protein [Sphingomonadaceae bacterium]